MVLRRSGVDDAPPPVQAPTATPPSSVDYADEIVRLINAERERQGLPALIRQSDLDRAAGWFAADMAASGRIAPTTRTGRPDHGRTPPGVRLHGRRPPAMDVAENIAAASPARPRCWRRGSTALRTARTSSIGTLARSARPRARRQRSVPPLLGGGLRLPHCPADHARARDAGATSGPASRPRPRPDRRPRPPTPTEGSLTPGRRLDGDGDGDARARRASRAE